MLERLRQCREFRDGAADTVAGVSIQIILEHGVEFVDQAAGFLLRLGAADTVLTAQQDNIPVFLQKKNFQFLRPLVQHFHCEVDNAFVPVGRGVPLRNGPVLSGNSALQTQCSRGFLPDVQLTDRQLPFSRFAAAGDQTVQADMTRVAVPASLPLVLLFAQ